MSQRPDEKIMKPYLKRLMRKHRAINRLIDAAKALGAHEQVKAMKGMRFRLEGKITALQRHYYGRAFSA